MRFPVRFAFFAVAALTVCAGVNAAAQAAPGSSSSQTTATQKPTPLAAPAYIAIDPLAGVRYDNRFDVSLGMAYQHIKAGPNLLQGANLGGLDLSASYWLTKRWGIEGTTRGYVGTSGAATNPYNIEGPFVGEYVFAAGPEWLGPHNKHGALIAHVLAGGSLGQFEHDLRGISPAAVGFYNTQVAPAMVMGGHIDLNRSAHWVFRITTDALLTDYSVNYGPKTRQIDINTGVSVGMEYKFKKKR